MNRRDFLMTTAALATWPASRAVFGGETSSRQIMTVSGAVPADRMGVTLPHEHVMVDFVGAGQVGRDRYDRDKVFQAVLPYLKQARQAGCRTLVECTPAYLGRDPVLLGRLAKASGLHILTNTGYYGARNGKFLPEHARMESADQLAGRWLSEWKEGIEGSGVRPGFIKIGVPIDGPEPGRGVHDPRAAAMNEQRH